LQRNAFTVAANILTAIGFALLLTGVYAIRGRQVNVAGGLLWGLAACRFTAAPWLGLPPELPGMAVAELTARQTWWIATAGRDGPADFACWPSAPPPGRNCWPRLDRGCRSDRCPLAPESHSEIPATLSHRFCRRRNADEPVVLGAARRRHQPGLRTNFASALTATVKFDDFHVQRPGFYAYSVCPKQS